jgi:phosphatidylethanolamine-binding protein (PEBP) family uncharacterized protein
LLGTACVKRLVFLRYSQKRAVSRARAHGINGKIRSELERAGHRVTRVRSSIDGRRALGEVSGMASFRARLSAIATMSLLCSAVSVAGCSDEATPDGGSGGTAGSGMTAGSAGTSGQAGSGGGSAGASGSAGAAGGGAAGSSGGGAGGASGNAGAGTGGGGTAGSSGNGGGGAGNAGGDSGGMSGAGAGGMSGAGAGGAGAGGMAGGGTSGAAGNAGTGGGSGEFTLTSPAFESLEGCGPDDDAEACDVFPVDNTRFGEDVSPELNWTNPPAGTQSYAIVFQDLSNGFAHWVMWNIPGDLTSLPAELPTGPMPSMPDGASQASFRADEAFTGSGACGNVYEFVLYALSDETISPTMTADQTAVRMFVQNLESILGQASMRARSAEPECG